LSTALIVYIREGCHLCDAFLDEFLPLARELNLAFDTVDVDSSESLQRLYGHRVPVLEAGNRVICEHFLDPAQVDKYVQQGKVG
jgi:hypothetical protein